MEEVWKPVVGYEGLYCVSSSGKIKGSRGVRKEQLTDKGYLRIHLSKNGKKKPYFVHDLVCLAFPEICGEWFEGAQCNHKNEVKTDNRAENLEVVDIKTNINYGTGVERRARKKEIPVNQYSIEGVFIKNWVSGTKAALVLGLMQQKISNCCRGKRKTHGGFKWQYA